MLKDLIFTIFLANNIPKLHFFFLDYLPTLGGFLLQMISLLRAKRAEGCMRTQNEDDSLRFYDPTHSRQQSDGEKIFLFWIMHPTRWLGTLSTFFRIKGGKNSPSDCNIHIFPRFYVNLISHGNSMMELMQKRRHR